MALAFVESGAITKYPAGLYDLRLKFPNVSFPKPLEGADLSSFDTVTVEEVPAPTYNRSIQWVEEGTPALVNGTWQQTWNVVTFTEEELQSITDGKAASVRKERDLKLYGCDWTVLPDNPLTAEEASAWKSYRTDLRNLTAQDGFPHAVIWPEEPGAS